MNKEGKKLSSEYAGRNSKYKGSEAEGSLADSWNLAVAKAWKVGAQVRELKPKEGQAAWPGRPLTALLFTLSNEQKPLQVLSSRDISSSLQQSSFLLESVII